MSKGKIVGSVAAAFICSGLIWMVGDSGNSGIAGWETLNVSMEQAIGISSDGLMDEQPSPMNGIQTGADSPASIGLTSEAITPAASTPVIAIASPIIEEVVVQPDNSNGKVNVNNAGTAELMKLPGIGEKKAQAIIDYRNSKGAFHSLSDLGKVKGIGPKMLEKLKPLVVF